MLEKNKKNLKSSDKHSGRAINSVLEYSTVPRNDAVEFEEVVTMNHEGSSVGLYDGERPYFRHVAWLLREKLNDLVDSDQGEPLKLELRSLLNMATSRKIISVNPKMLNPVLWRTLPKELLLLVLARLPVPDITRLRSLSKEWNKDMATVNSEINRACDETSPIMVAGFSQRFSGLGDMRMSKPEFIVTICAQRSQYSYRLHPGNPAIREDGWHDMGAINGGLVCFVSTWKPSKANPLCIVVVNLLTRVWRKLPRRRYVYLSPPEMMHIEVDSETKCYRVVVVDKNIKGRPTVEIYHSGARQWTKAIPSLASIFGLAFSWEFKIYNSFTFRSTSITRSMYDFGKGQLKYLDLMGPSKGASVITHVIEKDCMFVLHKNISNGEISPAEGHCITKYCLQTNAKDWVQERSYLCSPFEDLLEKDCSWWILKACEGFLMVFTYSLGSCGYFWLLDLSTGEWSSLPNCFDEEELHCGTLMTRASWNVVP